ncbi:MAG: ABC transporter permease, partial [Devosiaceae bacterium]
MSHLIKRYGGAAGMLLVFAFFALALPDTFLTARNMLNISQQISMLAVVAVTMTVVMVMGDFDLSVG